LWRNNYSHLLSPFSKKEENKEKKIPSKKKKKPCEKSKAECQRQHSKLELVKPRGTEFVQVET